MRSPRIARHISRLGKNASEIPATVNRRRMPGTGGAFQWRRFPAYHRVLASSFSDSPARLWLAYICPGLRISRGRFDTLKLRLYIPSNELNQLFL
jgi:hypothetical protein